MSQVEILQPPHAATGRRQHPHQRPEPPSGSGNFERNPASLRGLDEQQRGGFAEQRAAPLDGFVRQPSALLDHLVPAGERAAGGEGALDAAGEDGAPTCERLCVFRRGTAENTDYNRVGVCTSVDQAQALLAYYALGLQHMPYVPGLGARAFADKYPSCGPVLKGGGAKVVKG